MPGRMAIGELVATTMSGSPGRGNGRPILALTGPIRTTTITSKAGRSTKGIGTTRIIAIITMTITITTTMAITTTTNLATYKTKGPARQLGLLFTFSVFSWYSLLLNRVRLRSSSRGIERAHPDSPEPSLGLYAFPIQALR